MNHLQGLMALAVLVIFLVVPSFLKNYGIHIFTTWLVFIIATMGLNLTVGYAGQKSLGHAAFFGIGAYTVAIMLKAGLSFWLAIPTAALLCFMTGLILGFPALRVQTIYLAFATLGFNTALWLVMRNEEWLTRGTFGINNIVRDASEWEGKGFDLIVDYAGFDSTTRSAVKSVRRGGRVVLVGMGKLQFTLDTMAMIISDVELLGSTGGTKQDVADIYDLLASGEISPKVTEIGFADIGQGLDGLRHHRITGRLVAQIK